MNGLRIAHLVVLIFCCSVATTTHAVDEAPTEYLRKDLKIELSTFGKGMAEAFRLYGSAAKKGKATEYVVHSEQTGSDYKTGWITKKTEPIFSSPEYMQVAKKGTSLPGSIVIGKSTQGNVIERLGKPDVQNADRLTYYLPGYQGDDVAIFIFRNGRLASVQWLWFVD